MLIDTRQFSHMYILWYCSPLEVPSSVYNSKVFW